MSDNVAKIQQMYQAFGAGDIDTLLENVTDDVSWGTETVVSEVPWYRLRDGRDGVGDFFATLAREVDFPKFLPTTFAPVGDDVFVRVDYDYQFKRNGKGASTGAVHQFTLRDGKVSKFRAFEDTAAVRAAWNG
jgi:ketosteroid isomerase-like protein